MRQFLPLFACLFVSITCFAQTPVPMSSQPGLTYTENFSDITNWANGFVSGIGANRFGSIAVNTGSGIPAATIITTASTTFTSGTSGGIQKGTEQIVLLSTGSTDNTTSTAFDFFMDFTGVNAGVISFDWAVVFNSTGDRNGSLKVYATTDGTTFTNVTSAFVSNFTNNVTASGAINSVALPSSFNNSATARLRFYYHNSVGGATGSRPKISIDNLSITAVANTPCTTPAAQPTALTFGSITSSTIDGSFTAASPAPQGYLVVISNNSNLISLPIDGTTYSLGDNVGDGYVIANGSSPNFSVSALSPSTTYYFYAFSMNHVCTGGVKYLDVGPLLGSTSTTAGVPPCAVPTAQSTALVFGTVTTTSIQGSFTGATADGYLVLRSTSASLSTNPANAVSYSAGNIIGNATVVQQSSATSFTASSLTAATNYYFYIFSYNNNSCSNGPVYLTTSPLNGSRATSGLSPCITPTGQPTNITFTITNTAISGSFLQGSGNDAYLVIRSLSPTLSSPPVNNTDYNSGDNLGGGTVIASNSNKSFITTSLSPGTSYYFYIFSANKNCSGGTKYLTAGPLTGNATTTNDAANNYYFGNLHSHSDYSDGNKDNPGFTPNDNYSYAMGSQCMDYLGISEHNHYGAGTKVANYQLGVAQASNFTSANPGFVALYGMEWGVISGGGHVLVYSNGMNDLLGWESGSGSWGPTNNYNTFIAKSDYTGANGLFKFINDNNATNTFATLAHPNSTDFGNISNIAYDANFDAAIAGSAVETGPAFSTSTTYSDPGSSMSFLSYYKKMLSKGYHIGPSIDHDNHNTTFGRTTYSRTAVIAPAKTKTEIIKGFRNIHFYATQDCDSRVEFLLNTNIMGNTVVSSGAPAISVNITDATTSLSAAVIKVMFGVPGSNTNAVEINSAIGPSLNFVDNNLANFATGYYYIDITNGSRRIVTAPIWYTRLDNGILPVTFNSFDAQKTGNSVKLSWFTTQEINSKYFIIERSADGRNWSSLGHVQAAGNSSQRIGYAAYDNLPMNGTNYYRIKQVDKDGKFDVTEIRNVKFDLGYMVSISPNPATDIVTINFDKTNSSNSLVQFFDASGNLVFTENSSRANITINSSKFSRGLYFIKITNSGKVSTQKLILQ